MQATFPHLALHQGVRVWMAGQALDANESISGADTVVPTQRGRWMATAGFVIRDEAATLQWQAFLAQMQGRVGTTLVPIASRFRPKDGDGLWLPYCQIGGFAGHQTQTHWGVNRTQVDRVVIASAAPLRAIEIDITLVDSTGIRPGQYFSIGERLHRVQAAWRPTDTTHRIMFEPPLREAVPAGAHVEIQRPVCRMRMVSETEGVMDQLLDRLPSVEVNFVEAM